VPPAAGPLLCKAPSAVGAGFSGRSLWLASCPSTSWLSSLALPPNCTTWLYSLPVLGWCGGWQLGDNGFWGDPGPHEHGGGPPPACTNFPEGFNPVSGKIWWDSVDGATPCTAVVFYNGPKCTGSNTGIRRPNDTAAPITTDK